MGRLIIVFIVFFTYLNANNVYEKNCVQCHNKLPVSIDKYFYRYLLKYSSEKEVKSAIKKYLENPSKETTVMPQAFIKRFGVKKKTNLSKEDLSKALDIYWDKYKVFGKLK